MLTWKDLENNDEDWWVEEIDPHFKALMEYSIKLSQTEFTAEEGLRMMVNAGIWDENGNYTEPYKILEQLTASK